MVILAQDPIYTVYPAVPLMSVLWSQWRQVVNGWLVSVTQGVMTSLLESHQHKVFPLKWIKQFI